MANLRKVAETLAAHGQDDLAREIASLSLQIKQAGAFDPDHEEHLDKMKNRLKEADDLLNAIVWEFASWVNGTSTWPSPASEKNVRYVKDEVHEAAIKIRAAWGKLR